MRADRLVAILLMLQSRGRVTAPEVAAELEISERTARRDLDALATAGLPVYSTQGRNGGWELLGGGKTDLSGLNAAEARALFLVAGPSSSTTPELRAALRKLVRALPESFRTQAEAASAAVVVDPAGWDGRSSPIYTPPHLDALQAAVVEGRQVRLGYVARDQTPTQRTVHPLGLATKGRAWYLVADTEAGERTFRVDRVTAVEQTGEAVVRPAGFDLAASWRSVVHTVEERRTPAHASVVGPPAIVPFVRWVFGNRVSIGPPDADGQIPIEVRCHTMDRLAHELAGFGRTLEVIEPPELRHQLATIGAELTALYGRP